jgi:hypothetical protein
MLYGSYEKKLKPLNHKGIAVIKSRRASSQALNAFSQKACQKVANAPKDAYFQDRLSHSEASNGTSNVSHYAKATATEDKGTTSVVSPRYQGGQEAQ